MVLRFCQQINFKTCTDHEWKLATYLVSIVSDKFEIVMYQLTVLKMKQQVNGLHHLLNILSK